jgi:c-di-GMP-binding flagellar brake protein YcgR
MWQGMNQRKFPRASYKCVVKLHQEGEQASIPAVTENIGLGGICVIMEQGLDIFSPVKLELSLEDGKGPVKAKGTIVWVVRRRQVRKNIQFDTGVEFSGLSAESKSRLEAVLDKTTQTR